MISWSFSNVGSQTISLRIVGSSGGPSGLSGPGACLFSALLNDSRQAASFSSAFSRSNSQASSSSSNLARQSASIVSSGRMQTCIAGDFK